MLVYSSDYQLNACQSQNFFIRKEVLLLKIIYPVCCGIDVHKKFVVACIASTDERGITTYKVSRFSTFTSGLKKLSGWLYSNACTRCMHGVHWQVLDTGV